MTTLDVEAAHGFVLPYAEHAPTLAAPFGLAPMAAVAGRTTAGPGLAMGAYATVRADGESIRIGRNFFAGERATAHIWDSHLGTTIGDDVTVGRFGLVHACTLADGVVIGEHATVMDGAEVGPFALIGPGSVVPPRKKLAGGWLYAGHPAAPVREISRAEVAAVAAAIRAGRASALASSDDLPPMDVAGFIGDAPARGPLHAVQGRTPAIGRAFVAPTAVVAGDVQLADDAGIYFGCVVVARGARITIGRRTNVQDNTFLVTDFAHGDLVVGENVTFGHNVRMGAGRIEDDALIGMAARVDHGVVVERGACIAAGAWVEAGTVVNAGWIWAGRPARPFREVRPGERAAFAEGVDVYVRYGAVYLAQERGAR
jgi:carbonic anhydrase/acetyltransferase-like protein (isoleucine patch superfamily)